MNAASPDEVLSPIVSSSMLDLQDLTDFDINVMEEVEAAFRMFDQNDDGKIDVEEFYLVYKKLGFKFSQEQIENMVASISKSHEREIDLHEFVRLSQQIVKRHQRVISFEDELKMAFKVFDIDGDGFITAKELSKTLRALGQNVTDDDIRHMIDGADTRNADGKIDFEEFQLLMMGDALSLQDNISSLMGSGFLGRSGIGSGMSLPTV